MNHLPEDCSQWPHDCFQLLGVSNSVSQKELRRAYFRLIKKFKPDHAPREFQLIHEAYDTARQFIEHRSNSANTWNAWDDNPPSSADSNLGDVKPKQPAPKKPAPKKPLSDPAFKKAAFEPPASEKPADKKPAPQNPLADATFNEEAFSPSPKPPAKPPSQPTVDEMSRFQQYAANGKIAEALAVMPRIESRYDRGFAQLTEYFLRRTAASRHDIEEAKRRIGILLKFAFHPQYHEVALFYLRNEFSCRPDLARLKAVGTMIRQHNGNKQAHLIALERWKALGQDHPKIVALDMDALSQAMGLELETTAAEALEYTLWHDSPETRKCNAICQEILQDSNSELFDTVEILSLANEELTQADSPGCSAWNHNDIAWAVPRARTGFDSQMFATWQPVVDCVHRDHARSLTLLGHLARSKPIVMSIFLSGLARYARQQSTVTHTGNYRADINPYVKAFLDLKRLRTGYHDNRLLIVEFCIDHRIIPEALGMGFDQYASKFETQQWSELLRKDIALNCIYQAGIANQC